MKKLVLSAFVAMAAVAAATPTAVAQTVCPTAPAATVLSGNLSTQTLSRNTIYLLQGFVYVPSGVTLTIEPGTIIKGDKASKGTLIVQRGGKLIADGTAQQPIVFTSNQPANSRARGDWGGIILCGAAPQNLPGDPTIEGGPVANFGGTNAADNSGILRYVRIEFPGIEFVANNEINGLTLGGVGSGTTIDYVQISYSGDDSFEWFGGTVNAKHLIAFRGTDDDFDTDNGYSGKVQYGVALRDPQVADVASGGASNAFESDNDATGTLNTPQTSAVFSNMSVFLPGPLTAADPAFQRGVHIRRNSSISLLNSVVTGFRRGVLVDGATTEGNLTSGASVFKNNVFADINSGATTNYYAVNTGSTFDATAYFNDAARANTTYTAVGPLNFSATNFTINTNVAPGFGLPAASPLLTGAAFTDAKLADAFFEKTGTYRGAFGATNWAEGWTNFNPQITCYNLPGLTLAAKPASDQLQQLTVSPNPSAGEALLNFELKRSGTASVRVLDVTGRTVATVLANGRLAAGAQQLALPTSLKAGVYMAQVITNETSQSVRFVVAK